MADVVETFTLVAGKPTIAKDPNATLDYGLNLTRWLLKTGATAVASVAVTPVSGGMELAPEPDYPAPEVYDAGRRVRAWLTGGTPGQKAAVKFRWTTTSVPPHVDERTLYFKIAER